MAQGWEVEMRRFAWLIVPLALVFATALTGCHVLAPGLAEDSKPPGHGRTDQAFAVPLQPTLAATLAALDDLGVRPEKLTIQSGIETPSGQAAIGIEPEATNAAMLPAGERADDIFVRHQLAMPGAAPTPFQPIYAAYKGKAADGRVVLVAIATKRGNDADNLVTARIGHRGDAAWTESFLAKVAARIDGAPAPTAPPSSR